MMKFRTLQECRQLGLLNHHDGHIPEFRDFESGYQPITLIKTIFN